MKYFLPLLIFLISCKTSKEYNIVNIHLNPKSHGWHFIELTKVGPKENYKIAEVSFDSATYLRTATVSDYDAVDYNVYDGAGNEISSTMKLPGVISHHNKKTYFTFYNPGKQDLEEVKQWTPDDAGYKRIMQLQNGALDELLK